MPRGINVVALDFIVNGRAEKGALARRYVCEKLPEALAPYGASSKENRAKKNVQPVRLEA
jgi:hypothetical protein